MSRAQELAAEFERACATFVDLVEGLDTEAWRMTAGNNPDARFGPDERRKVCVVAHHVGDMLPLLTEIVRRRAAGEVSIPLTQTDVDAINARHAADIRHPDRAETAALIRDHGAMAASLIRGLTDEDLDRAGPGELPAEQVVRRVLIGHFAGHAASIRATVRAPAPVASESG